MKKSNNNDDIDINKHLHNLGVVSTEDLEKGLRDSLDKKNTTLKFKKKGLEIKEKLHLLKKSYIDTKDEYLHQIISLRTTIPTIPSDLIPDYFLRDVKLNKNTLPKLYSWSMIDVNRMSNDSTNQKMKTYNELVEDYTNILVEIVFIDTLTTNLQEEKEYELDTEQLINLGF